MGTVNFVRLGTIPEVVHQDSPIQTAWSNTHWLDLPSFVYPVGDTPIELILKLLISTGTGNNWSGTGPNYDDVTFEPGIGLGIAQDQVDLASFAAIQSAYDWDGDEQLYFTILEAEPAKEFIDSELCRPFGIYLRTGNDGKIRCVRPRHPQKFYVGSGNRALRVAYGGVSYTATMAVGVYDGGQMAAAVATALNNVSQINGFFTCTYNGSTHRFTLNKFVGAFVPDPFDLIETATTPGWKTLGWTLDPSPGTTTTTSDTDRGAFSGSLVTQDDMWSVQVIDNLDDRIAAVSFQFNYDPETKTYRGLRRYSDPEQSDLDDTFEAGHDYWIRSRGLIGGNMYFDEPESGCVAMAVSSPGSVSVNADTFTKLFALSLIDRYRQPPIKFRAKLKWKWNTLEVGDVVRVSYNVPGVFADHELNKDTLENRLFEIVELHPNFGGTVDATFLGHRNVSY